MAHIQSNAPDRSNFMLSQRRQESLNDLGLLGSLARVEDRCPREWMNRDLLSLVKSQPDVQLGICWFPDQDAGPVGFGDEAHEA